MDTKKLRQKILDLAIRGKLVPQDPNDEPASVLLERIRAEKERLIKEGKIKRSKKTATDNEIEAPFEIPESWVWCKLGDIGTWQSGATPSRVNKDYYGGDIPWLKTGDLNDGYIYDIPENITQKALEETSVKLNPAGSVLIAMYGATIGKIGILTFPATTNQACCACVDFQVVEQKYLFYFLLSHKEEFIMLGGGGAQPNISKEKIVDTLIPIPPLSEQKRIIDSIDDWFSTINVLEETSNDLKDIIKTSKSKILDLAIHGKLVSQDPNDEPAIELLKRIREDKNQLVKEGKLKKKDLEIKSISEDEIPFEIPESWKWVRLKSIASKIVDGDHNPPSGLSSDSGYYMLSSKNIDNDNIVARDDARFLSFEDWKKCNDRTNLKKGDILLTTVATLGRSCVYEDNVPYCFQRSVSIIHTFIFNYFLKYCFDSPYYQSLIDDKATGTAQRGFYLYQLEESIIPVPPFAEQHRIVTKIKELLAVLDSIKESLE